MDELASRALRDGSGTVISLLTDGKTFVVKAENVNGSCSVTVARADAARCYMHPFSRTDWLDYPGHADESLANAASAHLAHVADMADLAD